MTHSITEQRIAQLLTDNPAYRNIYCEVLEFCYTVREEGEVIACAEKFRTSNSQIQDAAGIIAVLVRKGALAQTVFVDGEVYVGSWDELQRDESIPLDAQVCITLQTTQDGRNAAKAVRELLSFKELIRENPQRIHGFETVLSFCDNNSGRSTTEIQQILKEENLLDTDPERGIDHLHASYFTGMLEKVGALVWKKGYWLISEQGKAVLTDRV